MTWMIEGISSITNKVSHRHFTKSKKQADTVNGKLIILNNNETLTLRSVKRKHGDGKRPLELLTHYELILTCCLYDLWSDKEIYEFFDHLCKITKDNINSKGH